MAIAILQGMQHKAMTNRHECNECVIIKMPDKSCSRVCRHYSRHCVISPSLQDISVRKLLITLVQGVHVYCKKVHKKQQTITSFSQKLHKSSDTKERRLRPTHKQGVRLDTRTIVTKVP